MSHSSCLCLDIGGAQQCPWGNKFMQKGGVILAQGEHSNLSVRKLLPPSPKSWSARAGMDLRQLFVSILGFVWHRTTHVRMILWLCKFSLIPQCPLPILICHYLGQFFFNLQHSKIDIFCKFLNLHDNFLDQDIICKMGLQKLILLTILLYTRLHGSIWHNVMKIKSYYFPSKTWLKGYWCMGKKIWHQILAMKHRCHTVSANYTTSSEYKIKKSSELKTSS